MKKLDTSINGVIGNLSTTHILYDSCVEISYGDSRANHSKLSNEYLENRDKGFSEIFSYLEKIEDLDTIQVMLEIQNPPFIGFDKCIIFSDFVVRANLELFDRTLNFLSQGITENRQKFGFTKIVFHINIHSKKDFEAFAIVYQFVNHGILF